MRDKINLNLNVVRGVRRRTWTLTLIIIVAMIFYFLMQVAWKEEVNTIDLCFMSLISVIIYCVYYPEGELAGQRSPTFIANKTAYNDKATLINENQAVGELREYCLYEYEKRKRKYIETECGAIGITCEELEHFKKLTPKEIRKLKTYSIVTERGEKLIIFTPRSKKHLLRLLFAPIPVEENNAEAILSACEIDFTRAIKDKSITVKRKAYVKKITMAILSATFLAYIGYSFADGITFDKIVRVVIYLTNMLTTAVLSFSNGEQLQKVHKNQYYIELSIYLDGFTEWLKKIKNKELKVQD